MSITDCGCMAVWLYGCMTVWLCGSPALRLCDYVAAWLSGYQYLEGGCLKAKAVYDCRIITLHFSMLQQLGSWLLHFAENVKWRHTGIPVKASTGALRQCARSTAWDLAITVFGNDWIKAGNTLTIETSDLACKGAPPYKATVTDSY